METELGTKTTHVSLLLVVLLIYTFHFITLSENRVVETINVPRVYPHIAYSHKELMTILKYFNFSPSDNYHFFPTRPLFS